MQPEDEHLLRLAAAVADGSPVDWRVESDAHPSLRRKIDNLVVLESIRVNQSPAAETATATAPEDSGVGIENANGAGEENVAVITHWGPLEIRGLIGRGGFGEVYRAYDRSLQREVALKLPRSNHPRYAKTFLSEARRLARVRHQNVLQVLGAEEHDDRIGIWTDLLEGRTLEECLEEQGPFGPREAALIGIDLCRALAAVHGAGMVHRDVKTSNVIREEGGRIVLLDFSSVTERPGLGAGVDAASSQGTPIFMAPEQLEGEAATKAGDIYSLGVLLFRLVTNRYPFEADKLQELRLKHRYARPDSLLDLRPDLPTSFVSAVDQALAAEPVDRFQSAGEMERALAGSLGSNGVIEKTSKSLPGRLRTWLWPAMAAMLIVVAGLWMFKERAGRGSGIGAVGLEATLYRKGPGLDERLVDGSQLSLGDRLFLEVEANREMYLYVLNEDSAGRRYVLFPLPGLDLANPLPPHVEHQIPGMATKVMEGTTQEEERFWQVSSVGGRETMLVIAAAEALDDLESRISTLPLAGSAAAVELDELDLPKSVLRGIGAVQSVPRQAPKTGQESLKDLAIQLGMTDSKKAPAVWTIELSNPG